MNLIKRHSIPLYFLLTFLISWGGLILIIGGFENLILPNNKFNSLLPMVISVILAGPSLSGIIMTIINTGRKSLEKYKSLLFKKNIKIKWYLISILTGPLAMLIIYLILSFFSEKFIPSILTVNNKTNHLIMGLMTGLAAGFFEEVGWTGFAIPQLKKQYDVLKTGLIVGLLWAFWHTLPGVWIGYSSGTVTNITLLMSYFADSFLFLIIFRILMVWVYDKTESLFIAMIMHFSLTSAARILPPIGIVGIQLLTFDFIWLIVLLFITTIALRRT